MTAPDLATRAMKDRQLRTVSIRSFQRTMQKLVDGDDGWSDMRACSRFP